MINLNNVVLVVCDNLNNDVLVVCDNLNNDIMVVVDNKLNIALEEKQQVMIGRCVWGIL